MDVTWSSSIGGRAAPSIRFTRISLRFLLSQASPSSQGETLGIMGFTGAGIDRERAHAHFEICMMLSRNFEGWHQANFPRDPNRHGIYNGLNLAGTDPAALLLAAQRNPTLKASEYFSWRRARLQDGPQEFAELLPYPRIPVACDHGGDRQSAGLDDHVFAVRRAHQGRGSEIARRPTGSRLGKETDEPYARITKHMVAGSRGSPHLTPSGLRFAKLLAWPD